MSWKKTNYLVSVLIIVLSLAACKKDEGVVGDYGASYNSWKAFKKEVDNSYQYAVTTASWTGYSSETILTIKNGRVIQRAYLSKSINGQSGVVKIIEQWIEDSGSLNTHNEGAATLTLDEVYNQAKNQWLVRSKKTDTYFEANNQGMLSTAGYTDKNCMDDCFVGIKISFIRKITTNL